MDVTVTFTETSNKIDVSPLFLTFTMDNWDTAQFITVQGLADADATDEVVEVTTSTTSSDSAYDGLTGPTLTVTVTDNDTAGVTIEEVSTIAREDGVADASYTVKLDTQPTDTVTITPSLDVDVTVSPLFLEFSTTDWATPKTFVVMAVNDDFDDDGESVMITHSATSDDPKYDSISSSSLLIETVTVMITDNNMAGVTVDPGSLTLIEGHATDSSQEYTVVLTSKPTANVNLALSPSSVNAFTTDRQSCAFHPGQLEYGGHGHRHCRR